DVSRGSRRRSEATTAPMNLRPIQLPALALPICSAALCIAVLYNAAPCFAAAPANPAYTPPALKDVAIEQKLDVQVPPNLMFTDELGRPVKLSDYFGKRPLILALVYYECPMLCTMVLNEI